MIVTATSTWVSGPQHPALYGVLCVLSGAWAWRRWRRVMGRAESAGLEGLDTYELALLNGGRQLAITAAATQLHRDGALSLGWMHTLEAARELGAGAHPLERDVFETVRREPGVWISDLRAEVAGGDAMRSMTARLTDAGALLDSARAARLRPLWLVGLGLTALGAAGIVARATQDAPVDVHVVLVTAVALVTYRLASARPIATARGRAAVKRRRMESLDLLSVPMGRDSALAVALFGGAALWATDPEIARALGVPREQARRTPSGDGCSAAGSCAGGCGGCA